MIQSHRLAVSRLDAPLFARSSSRFTARSAREHCAAYFAKTPIMDDAWGGLSRLNVKTWHYYQSRLLAIKN
ncbi:hypothetical protein [Novosphingobium sp. KN65.2]|uniref:hypothetical protein n=1 Tax=Novosphingobium sp. KN65.2 TaxID=1478134 RepID=UPI0005DC5325|nr:hypothetical protein [Novosphingobium sp. KN65.2]CDO37774.1 hypothetical protein SPHV1_400003 [Novosphingobium sp. KN65.2]